MKGYLHIKIAIIRHWLIHAIHFSPYLAEQGVNICIDYNAVILNLLYVWIISDIGYMQVKYRKENVIYSVYFMENSYSFNIVP